MENASRAAASPPEGNADAAVDAAALPFRPPKGSRDEARGQGRGGGGHTEKFAAVSGDDDGHGGTKNRTATAAEGTLIYSGPMLPGAETSPLEEEDEDPQEAASSPGVAPPAPLVPLIPGRGYVSGPGGTLLAPFHPETAPLFNPALEADPAAYAPMPR